MSNLFIKDFTNFSLAGANGSLIKHSFLLSNDHCVLNNSSFSWLNLRKTSFIIWIGKTDFFISLLKFDAVLFPLCNFPVIALHLYVKGILLLQWMGNFFRPCVYRDKDNTFKLLNRLRKNENIVLLSDDKESCMVILNKTDYVNKVNPMINEGISKDKYVETVNSTHKDLKHFQDFLYRRFYETKYYDGMRLISNKTTRFFATAKTHKSNTTENINVKDLKLRLIIDQTRTYIYMMHQR